MSHYTKSSLYVFIVCMTMAGWLASGANENISKILILLLAYGVIAFINNWLSPNKQLIKAKY